MLGRHGVAAVPMSDMSAEERVALDKSAETLRTALCRVEKQAV